MRMWTRVLMEDDYLKDTPGRSRRDQTVAENRMRRLLDLTQDAIEICGRLVEGVLTLLRRVRGDELQPR
jgi:hypothetical protein